MHYVNLIQKGLTYAAYYGNALFRRVGRNVEKLARPIPSEEGYWAELAERVKLAAFTLGLFPCAAVLLVPSFTLYGLASCAGKGRFEWIGQQMPPIFQGQSIKVLSLNVCFQDPWSPLTGGVVSPHDPVGNYPSRIAAVVDLIARKNPDVFLGQEFDNLGAQDESIRLMQQRGYRYFLRDLGSDHPVQNPSGLFVASKIPLENIAFVPYPAEVKGSGVGRWSARGALILTIRVGGSDLRVVNVHLNPGDGPENDQARIDQLQRHIAPLLQGNSVVIGDLNFDTSSVNLEQIGFSGFINLFEGQVTCTDLGKHQLLGKNLLPNGQPCGDCEQRIDGLLYHPEQVRVTSSAIEVLELDGRLLSDHYALSATLQTV